MNSNSDLSPEEIVQKQLEAYNSRDMETYISLFSDDVEFYNYGDHTLTMEGKEACRNFYQDLFDASPNLHSTTLKRIVHNNVVIEHESITGRKGLTQAITMVLIFVIENKKISKVTVIK